MLVDLQPEGETFGSSIRSSSHCFVVVIDTVVERGVSGTAVGPSQYGICTGTVESSGRSIRFFSST